MELHSPLSQFNKQGSDLLLVKVKHKLGEALDNAFSQTVVVQSKFFNFDNQLKCLFEELQQTHMVVRQKLIREILQ
jgi:hypothetical protein